MKNLRKAFILTHESPCIKKTSFRNIKSGDIFYLEEPDGKLVVEFMGKSVIFLWIAMSDAEMSVVGYRVNVNPLA